VLGDALGSVVVIVSALVVWLAGEEYHPVTKNGFDDLRAILNFTPAPPGVKFVP
jgi:Co/Zn/Cd efflux system component